MAQIHPLDTEYVINEKVDVIFEPVLFTNILTNELGKKKPQDMLPVMVYIKADLELRNFQKSGIKKKVSYSQIKKELNKLVLCN